MKRKGDGWNGPVFRCNGTIFDKREDQQFDKTVELVVANLKGVIRPGEFGKRGSPLTCSILTTWLLDHANFLVEGDWGSRLVREAHLNIAAQRLRYPERWMRGDVQYCVSRVDYTRIEAEIQKAGAIKRGTT